MPVYSSIFPLTLRASYAIIAFNEIAEIYFKNKDAITIMKDYMASGSFSRGKEFLEGEASMVFVGNINKNIYFASPVKSI